MLTLLTDDVTHDLNQGPLLPDRRHGARPDEE